MTHHSRRVLIVEDEMFVAMLIEDMLTELGHTVAGIASRVGAALKMVESLDFNFAILDVNLAGELSFPVADAIAGRGLPFMFATGYGAHGLAEPHTGRPVITKPFSAEELAHALRTAVEDDSAAR